LLVHFHEHHRSLMLVMNGPPCRHLGRRWIGDSSNQRSSTLPCVPPPVSGCPPLCVPPHPVVCPLCPHRGPRSTTTRVKKKNVNACNVGDFGCVKAAWSLFSPLPDTARYVSVRWSEDAFDEPPFPGLTEPNPNHGSRSAARIVTGSYQPHRAWTFPRHSFRVDRVLFRPGRTVGNGVSSPGLNMGILEAFCDASPSSKVRPRTSPE